jgi:O-antigen/teichoic acid export membrane protein
MSNQFGAAAMFRSALLMTGSTYVAYGTGLVISTLIARALGPADYGRYAYLIWLSGVLVILMNNGLTTSAIRFLSETLGRNDPTGTQRLHGWFKRRQWWAIAAVSLVFAACLPWLKPAGWESHMGMLAAVCIGASMAKALYLFGISVGKGHGRFDIEARSLSLLSVLNLVIVVALFMWGGSLDGYLWLFLLISLAHPLMARYQLRQAQIHVDSEPTEPTLLDRVRPHLWWTILSTFVWAFSNKSVETFLLNKLVSAEAVGFFVIAATLTRGGVELLSSGLSTILMPKMGNAYGEGGVERVGKIACDSIRLFHFLGLLLAGVGVFWAEPVIHLMYGERFAPAAALLQIMVVVRGATLSSAAVGSLLTTTEHQSLRAAESIFTLAVSLAAALWLVPLYGLNGAMAAHVLSTSASFLFSLVCVRLVLHVPMPYGDMARLSAAALCAWGVAMGLPALLHNTATELMAGVLYVLVYAFCTLLFRVWNQHDVALLGTLSNRVPQLRWLPYWLIRWTRMV